MDSLNSKLSTLEKSNNNDFSAASVESLKDRNDNRKLRFNQIGDDTITRSANSKVEVSNNGSFSTTDDSKGDKGDKEVDIPEQ